MIQTEPLTIDVVVSGTFWDKHPQFSVWFDDHVIVQTEIAKPISQTVSFTKTVDEGIHSIKVRLENKTKCDTIVENGVILRDMLLNIEDIRINNIGIGNLRWNADYILDAPQVYQGKSITKLTHCINLGWNGTYIFKFSTPFYQWLLEKL